MIHIYCGDGKGKTTSACGLAVRAAGQGLRVLFAQFFKDGTSGEVDMLRRLGVDVVAQSPHLGMYKTLNEEGKEVTRAACERLFAYVCEVAAEYDMIVLDEMAAVCRYGVIMPERAAALLRAHRDEREIIVTGRSPSPELLAVADYVTEMKKVRHPFEVGIPARPGIEY